MIRKLLILAILLLVNVPVFAQSVDTAWVRRYNGPGNSADYSYAITVDGAGNVYITGFSYGIGTDEDYATIKYYPNGDTAWINRYNGVGNSIDEAYAIAVDDSGNVYVTGTSGTIKYDNDGIELWIGSWGGGDIAIDDSGNVYVTGYRWGGETYNDYTTIKYYPNGDTAWVRTYNGPGNSGDEAYAIAVDGSGNVYVTGGSSSGTSYDYATIKYYPNGDTAWVRRYDGPGSLGDQAYSLALGGSGNVYVTGESFGSSETWVDFATIKYDSEGDIVWVRRYNGPANRNDYAYAIAVDDSDNVYVTGWSDGGTYGEYATIKYYPNGDTAWIRRYKGPENSYDYALAVCVDSSDNVYVTGSSMGSGTDYDCATIKYYPDGDTAWVRRYNGPENGRDVGKAIAVDNSGNVYVTGSSPGSGTDYDYATIKYVQFLCGDVNKDGVVNVTDIVYLINYLFIGGPAPVPILHVGDVNQDEVVDVTDVVYLINHLFISGPAPCS